MVGPHDLVAFCLLLALRVARASFPTSRHSRLSCLSLSVSLSSLSLLMDNNNNNNNNSAEDEEIDVIWSIGRHNPTPALNASKADAEAAFREIGKAIFFKNWLPPRAVPTLEVT